MKKYLTRVMLAAMVGSGVSAQAQKISKDLADANGTSSVKVIVQWKTPLSDAKVQKMMQKGGSLHAHLASIKASTYTVPVSALSDLANDDDVAFVSPDRPVHSKLDLSAAAVNAPYVWNLGFNGSGVGVAVIDSGMNASFDLTLKNNIVYNQDFTGEIKADANVANTNNAPDLYGHGQHVAGIIASSGKTSACGNCTRLLKGIAPGVNLVNLRALDENGIGTDSMVIAAIEKAIALKSTYNIRVINLSLGRPVYESYTLDPLCQAVEQAWKAGIVVVVAAGNDGRDNSFGTQGYGTIAAPGNDPYVITVGAMKTEGTINRTDDLIASYSSKGPTQVDHIVKPDLVAPGNQVVSLLAKQNVTLVTSNPANVVPVTYYQGSNDKGSSNAYFTLSGTSMATPVVSGGVADLLQAQPSLTPDQVKALLMMTAYKTFPSSSTVTDPTSGLYYVSYYDMFTVGAGYLDLQAALQNVKTPPAGASALSPTANYNAQTGEVSLSTGSAIWSTQTVWGVRSVWGTSTVWGNRSVWGTSTVWGNRSVWATSTVWGVNTDSAESVDIAVQGEP